MRLVGWILIPKGRFWVSLTTMTTPLPARIQGELLKAVVVVPGYTLWDIVSYSMEHMLNGIFSVSGNKSRTERDKRFMETAQRFYPLLKMKEGYMVFRPLIKYNQNDILKNIEQAGIPILSNPCRFRDFRPKRILEKYYEKTGLRFEYDRVFGFARRSLNLPDSSAYTSIEKEEYLLDIF